MVDIVDTPALFVPVVRVEVSDLALGGNETNSPNRQYKSLAQRDNFLLKELNELKSALASQTNGGRLSIDATNPTPNEFRRNSNIVYWLPYNSSQIALWDGTTWDVWQIPSGGLQVDTSAWAPPQTRDIFVYRNPVGGTLGLETRTWADYKNVSGRGYVIENFQGVPVLATDRSRRFLGCVFRSAQSTLGSPGIHDDLNIVDLWNVTNQVEKSLLFSTSTDTETVTYTTPRIAKAVTGTGALNFDFFRLVSGNPNQPIQMFGIGQLVGAETGGSFYGIEFAQFADRQSVSTTAPEGVPIQINASTRQGLAVASCKVYNRGTQTYYIRDYRGTTGTAPSVSLVRGDCIWRY